jgi:hypothetical protein
LLRIRIERKTIAIPMDIADFVATTVRKSFISTSSSSAMSTPANPPLPVRDDCTHKGTQDTYKISGHLIYKCGGIDKRTIEKFEKVGHDSLVSAALPIFWWGRGISIT